MGQRRVEAEPGEHVARRAARRSRPACRRPSRRSRSVSCGPVQRLDRRCRRGSPACRRRGTSRPARAASPAAKTPSAMPDLALHRAGLGDVLDDPLGGLLLAAEVADRPRARRARRLPGRTTSTPATTSSTAATTCSNARASRPRIVLDDRQPGAAALRLPLAQPTAYARRRGPPRSRRPPGWRAAPRRECAPGHRRRSRPRPPASRGTRRAACAAGAAQPPPSSASVGERRGPASPGTSGERAAAAADLGHPGRPASAAEPPRGGRHPDRDLLGPRGRAPAARRDGHLAAAQPAPALAEPLPHAPHHLERDVGALPPAVRHEHAAALPGPGDQPAGDRRGDRGGDGGDHHVDPVDQGGHDGRPLRSRVRHQRQPIQRDTRPAAAATAPKVGTPTTAHHEPERDASASRASTSEVLPAGRDCPGATAMVLPRRRPRLGRTRLSSGSTGSTRWTPDPPADRLRCRRSRWLAGPAPPGRRTGSIPGPPWGFLVSLLFCVAVLRGGGGHMCRVRRPGRRAWAGGRGRARPPPPPRTAPPRGAGRRPPGR